jgi:O-acetyl-ADP-ribose deacetylase (regulator of RNase III)
MLFTSVEFNSLQTISPSCVCRDAIVNAANSSLLGSSSVGGVIYRGRWRRNCWLSTKPWFGCKTDQAKLTRDYRLPACYGSTWPN